jgi:hypothetical protein
VLERQSPLPFVPVDHRKHHAALKHLSLEVGSMLFLNPLYLKRSSVPCRSEALSAASAPRTASYIVVRLSFVNAAQFIE